MRGLAGIRSLKQLDDALDDGAELTRFADRLRRIHALVLRAPRQFLLIGERERHEQLRRELEVVWGGRAAAGDPRRLVLSRFSPTCERSSSALRVHLCLDPCEIVHGFQGGSRASVKRK